MEAFQMLQDFSWSFPNLGTLFGSPLRTCWDLYWGPLFSEIPIGLVQDFFHQSRRFMHRKGPTLGMGAVLFGLYALV